jgi:hypothetical protein
MTDVAGPSSAATPGQIQDAPPEVVDLAVHPSGIVPKLQVRVFSFPCIHTLILNHYPSPHSRRLNFVFSSPFFLSLFLSTERCSYSKLRMLLGP